MLCSCVVSDIAFIYQSQEYINKRSGHTSEAIEKQSESFSDDNGVKIVFSIESKYTDQFMEYLTELSKGRCTVVAAPR